MARTLVTQNIVRLNITAQAFDFAGGVDGFGSGVSAGAGDFEAAFAAIVESFRASGGFNAASRARREAEAENSSEPKATLCFSKLMGWLQKWG